MDAVVVRPPVDTGGAILFWYMVTFVIPVMAIVIALEGLTLRALRWGSLLRSIAASFVGNLVSLIIGIAIFSITTIFFTLLFNARPYVLIVVIYLISNWILSVIVETPILWLFRRRSLRSSLRFSAIANAVSYGLALIVYISWEMLPYLRRIELDS